MAFTPFFQGTDAQSVINNYLGTGSTATTPMPLQDMNANNVFRNPTPLQVFMPVSYTHLTLPTIYSV